MYGAERGDVCGGVCVGGCGAQGVWQNAAQAAAFTFFLNFALSTLTDAVLFFNTAAASLLFGANVDVFLEAARNVTPVTPLRREPSRVCSVA